MKKFLLLLTLLCTMFSTAMATEVLIGDPSTATANTSLPFSSTFNYGFSQQIYTANEITEAGGSAGTITSLSLWMYNTSTITSFPITIYMAEVSDTVFASTSSWVTLTASNLVYTGTLVNLPASAADVAAVEITLDTPFSYNGTDNLLIAFTNGAGSWNSGFNCLAFGPTTGTAYPALYKNQDSGAIDPTNPGSITGTRSLKRNVIKLDITPSGGTVVVCNKPDAPSVTDVTATSATLNVSGGSEVYNVEIKKSSDKDWSDVVKNTTSTSIQLTNLAPNTSYQVRVQSVCGDNTSGYMSASFKTLIALPYEDALSVQGDWTKKQALLSDILAGGSFGTATGSWGFGARNGVLGGNHAYRNVYGTGCKDWIISPVLPLPEGGEYHLTFDLALTDYNNANPIDYPNGQADDKFTVLISTDNGATWSVLRQWDNTGSSYIYNQIATEGEEAEIDLTAYAGMSVQIAFYCESTVGTSGTEDNDIHVGNVVVELIPTCLSPDSLAVVAANTTKTSVQLDWVARSSETAWVLEYKKPTDSVYTSLDITQKPYTLTGLDEFTEYIVRIAANCDPSSTVIGEGISKFCKPITIKTASGVPFVQSFDTTLLPSEWVRYEALLSDLINDEDAKLVATTDGWGVKAANQIFPNADYHLVLNLKDSTSRYWIVGPTIEMAANQQLSFDLAFTKAAGNKEAVEIGKQKSQKFYVFITTNGGATWTTLKQWDNAGQGAASLDGINTEGTTAKIDLTAYASNSIQIAFYGESTVATDASNNLHIANVKIDDIPACEKPTSLVITGIKGTTATAVWESDEDGLWQYGYVVKPTGEFAVADSLFMDTTSAKILNMTGLSETTHYMFFVRRICDNDTSEAIVKEFATIQTPVDLPYENDFETENGWKLINGNLENHWVWNEAARANNTPNGSKALYISNDAFGTYAYTRGGTGKAAMVYAVKTFYFDQPGMYSFQYDWKCWGYSSIYSTSRYDYDYLRVALIPSETELEASTAVLSGFGGTTLPTDWTALDGGVCLSVDSAWNHELIELTINKAGYYQMVFAWRNGTSTSGKNPPAAVDNIKIARIACTKPSHLTYADLTATSVEFNWDAVDGATFECALIRADQDSAFLADPVYVEVPNAAHTISFDTLVAQTDYKFYLRKACGEEDGNSDPISLEFTTECLAYSIAANGAYTEGFENYTATAYNAAGVAPDCWSVGGTSNNVPHVVTSDNSASYAWTHSGTKSFSLSGTANSYCYGMLPIFAEDLNSLQIKFWARMESASSGELYLGYVTVDAPETFQTLKQIPSATTMTEHEIILDALPDNAKRLVFLWNYTGSSYYSCTIDDITVEEIPTCLKPTDLAVIDSLTTTNSATITWTPGLNETNWFVQYKKSADSVWTFVPDSVKADTLVLAGLEPASAYDVRVASWCNLTDSTTEVSEYCAPISFITGCEVITTFPYKEGFDSIAAGTSGATNILPICWDYINTTSYSSYKGYPTLYNSSSYANTPNNSLKFYSYAYGNSSTNYDPQDQYAILPEMEGISGLRIKLNARRYSASYDATFTVGLMTDPTDTATFVVFDTISPTSATYESYVIPFNADTTGARYIAIKMDGVVVPATSSAAYRGVHIDDIVVEAIPNCLEPTGLAVIDTTITLNSAVLTWTAQGDETEWILQYKKHADSVWTDVPALNDTLLLENLESATKYDVRVAAKCGATELSAFTAEVSFVTACGAYSIVNQGAYTEGFEDYEGAAYNATTGEIPNCWDAVSTGTVAPHVIKPGDTYAYVHGGKQALTFYGSGYCYAVLPEFAEPLNTLQISFWAAMESATNGTLKLGYITNETGIFHEIATYDRTTAKVMAPYETVLSAVPDSAARLVFEWYYSGQWSCCIDDVEVKELPSCLKPEGTITIVEVGQDTAKISWTAPAEGVQLQYAYVLKDSVVAEDAFVNADTNVVVLRGLTPDTEYMFYLRRNCESAVSESLSASFLTKQAPVEVGSGFADDFENGNHWTFINGTLTNAWAYGEAAHNGEGTHALYISNDGGTTNAYTNNTAVVVYATKAFNFAKGNYTFKYDWICKGESTYDYLRVALVPDSVELTAATTLPTGVTYQALPANWIALDGGSKLNLVEAWQTFTTSEIAVKAGTYNVVLLWRDDTSSGTNPPAAVDNFSIVKTLCAGIDSLAVIDRMATTATINWVADEEQDTWEVAYDTIASLRPDTLSTLATVTTKPHVLENLNPETTYYIYVRANCGDEHYSKWANVSFTTASTCQTPDAIKADSITTTSALISWNTYGQTGFNLLYTDGTNADTIYNVACPYLLEGLEMNTTYAIKVQAACAEANKWSSQITFKTAYGIPFREKFDALTAMPSEWKQYTGLLSDVLEGGSLTATTYGWTFTSNTTVLGSKHIYTNIYGTSRKNWIVLPNIVMENNVQLTFNMALSKSTTAYTAAATNGIDDKFAVVISADNGNTWSVLRQWDNDSASTYVYNNIALHGEEVAIDLSAYAGRAIQLAFYGESTVSNADNYLHIDDILLDFIPTCIKPTGLTVSEVKAHTAKIAWTAGAEGQDAWQIAYATKATEKPDTLANILNVTANPYVLENLDPSTTYYVYVRANCGENDKSRWTDGKSFKTTVACPAPKNLKAVLTPGNGTIATLKWSAGGDEQSWRVEYSLNANMSDSIAVVVEDSMYSITGLIADTTYYARVLADCGQLDSLSAYSTKIEFMPTSAYRLTLNDGTTTNEYVPVEGYYVDNATQRSQFIIPEADLEELEWDSIKSLTFYASNANVNWGAALFDLYIGEAEETTLSAEADWEAMTKVMNAASLSIVNNKMVVTLDSAYQYQGGNLMIGLRTAVIGSYARAYWYGETVRGASMGGHGDVLTQRNFLPKMTIDYVPGVAPACPNPKNLKVVSVAGDSAIFSWKAVEGAAWEYAVVEASAEPTEFIAVAEGANAVVVKNLAENTQFMFYLRRACGEDGYSEVLSVPFETEEFAQFVDITYTDDLTGWKFKNNATNAWVIGDATTYLSDNALYISNDGGTTYAYDDETPAVSYATKLFDFSRAGTFTVSYDYKCVGETSEEYGTTDYMRAAFVPADAELAADELVTGLSATSLPADWITLDDTAAVVAQEAWEHMSVEVVIPTQGLHRLVFAWINDEGLSDGDPAAIANLTFIRKSYATGIESGAGIKSKAYKFIQNGHVYFIVNDVLYDATGRKVK